MDSLLKEIQKSQTKVETEKNQLEKQIEMNKKVKKIKKTNISIED
jgi:hypothetical protein